MTLDEQPLDAVDSLYDGYRWSFRFKRRDGTPLWMRLVTIRGTTYSGDWCRSYARAKASTVRRAREAGEI